MEKCYQCDRPATRSRSVARDVSIGLCDEHAGVEEEELEEDEEFVEEPHVLRDFRVEAADKREFAGSREEWERERLRDVRLDEKLKDSLREAERKAWDSLGRYEFQMFGYWAGVWVHLNRIGGFNKPNPFEPAVKLARGYTKEERTVR